MDPALNFIKTAILSNSEASQDLFKAARLFKSLFEATKNATNGQQQRNANRTIGGQRTNRMGGFGRGPRRGRGGRHGNNFGRGRGNGGGRGGRSHQNNGGRGQGGDMYISPQILRQMTPAQRKAFYTGRDAMQKQNDPIPPGNEGRIIGGQQQEREQGDEPGQQQQAHNPVVRFDAASDQFGRAGRQLQGRGGGRQRQQGAIKCFNCQMVSKAQSQTQGGNVVQESTDFNGRYCLEIDSRADTACCGKGWKVLYYTGQVVNVSSFHDSFEEIKDVPIAACYTTYDHPEGHTYVLIANEALFFGDTMEHSLIPPAQIWNNGLLCDITPKHCSNGKSIFGIMDQTSRVHLPFQLHGCIAYLPTRLPQANELDNFENFVLTSDAEWNPYSTIFAEQERPFLPPNMHYNYMDEFMHATYDFTGDRVIRATSSTDH